MLILKCENCKKQSFVCWTFIVFSFDLKFFGFLFLRSEIERSGIGIRKIVCPFVCLLSFCLFVYLYFRPLVFTSNTRTRVGLIQWKSGFICICNFKVKIGWIYVFNFLYLWIYVLVICNRNDKLNVGLCMRLKSKIYKSLISNCNLKYKLFLFVIVTIKGNYF